MKTLIGINTLSSVSQPIYSNHVQFNFKLGKLHGRDHQFMLMTPPRMTIDRMRNESCRIAMEQECDYVMFIDDDILVPERWDDGTAIDLWGRWHKLMSEQDIDILASYTIIRGYPFNNMHFRWNEDHSGLEHYNSWSPNEITPEGLLKCDAIGCSLVMIKTSVLREVSPPYFVTGPFNTEDIYFCMKAAAAIPELKIYVDTQIKTGHLLAPLAVTPDNKLQFMEFEETLDPNIDSSKEHDRGDEYHEELWASHNLEKNTPTILGPSQVDISISVADRAELKGQ